MAERGALSCPATTVTLVRQLAVGDRSNAELAAEHGVSRQAVAEFAKRHAPRIVEVRRHFEDQFAGVTYASKVNRVAALSDLASDTLNLLRDPAQMAKVNIGRAELIRAATSTLRAIADELGQIPQKVQVQVGGQLDVQVNGVSTDDLR